VRSAVRDQCPRPIHRGNRASAPHGEIGGRRGVERANFVRISCELVEMEMVSMLAPSCSMTCSRLTTLVSHPASAQ